MIKSSRVGIAVLVAALFPITACTPPPHVPFIVMDTTGGICNTAAQGSANPRIEIENHAEAGTFVVTSILLKTADTGVPTTGFVALLVNSLSIDGTRFHTLTRNLVGPTAGSGVLESADLMGTPVIRGWPPEGQDPGGNFPHQIVANNEGSRDISVSLFCRSDDQDLNIAVVAAAGWKQPDDSITVTYIPGQ
ncbi:MAG: hypothetical protein GTN62_05630 [Gemmatimonadales bacterium]|nr:hypothetical protein [Gemmatimonadales bacterium]NIN10985.1 hypothetical protein [Gemmatimonadales bacterium]NIN49577.1 hypothetical protein [Gemmatimonadales bacterium]NIP07041.1 hypothetical protein [Gemmatimonadales bacterium]NIR01675.1 hypothetical protein [Gemmatimonadales bacterium]